MNWNRPFTLALHLVLPLLAGLLVPLCGQAEEERLRDSFGSLEAELPEADRLTLGAGVFIPYSGKVTRFESGDVTFADQILPTLGFEYRQRWDRFPGYTLQPQIWVTPLGNALKDGAGTSRWMSATLLVGKQEKAAEFRAGGGWLLQWIHGSGGESVQQNGSSTSTYALPDRNVIVRMLTLQAGLSYQADRLRFSADVIGTGLLSSRRTANAVFGIGWSFR